MLPRQSSTLLDGDDQDVFDQTVDWAVSQGLTTATFHIATPYPGTAFFKDIERQGRLLHTDWDLYDTRHTVFQPKNLTSDALEEGYWRSYRQFYNWPNIVRSSGQHSSWHRSARHLAYAVGWKKFEPLWDAMIRFKRLSVMRPVLESILSTVRGEPIQTKENSEPAEIAGRKNVEVH